MTWPIAFWVIFIFMVIAGVEYRRVPDGWGGYGYPLAVLAELFILGMVVFQNAGH